MNIANNYVDMIERFVFPKTKPTQKRGNARDKRLKSRYFQTPYDMALKAAQYFDYCVENSEPITQADVANHLGFCSKEKMKNYKQYSDEFERVIDWILNVCGAVYERRLSTGKGGSGDIFMSKNYGFTDKVEHEINNVEYELKIGKGD